MTGRAAASDGGRPYLYKAIPIMRLIRFAALAAWFLPSLLAAQTPRLLRFDAPERSLDTIREADGAVKLRYAFTNVSDKPVTLLDVHTQCGCLRPSYGRTPVAPGGQGVVEAVFDPKNRLGDFSIGLTVISTNGDYKKFNTLTVRGYVISRIPEAEIFYPYVLSAAFRADVDAVGMRRFRPGDGPRTRQIRLYNSTDRAMRPVYVAGSRHLRMSGPAAIAPRSEAVVEYELDPRGMPPGSFAIRSLVRTEDGDTTIEVRGLIAEK